MMGLGLAGVVLTSIAESLTAARPLSGYAVAVLASALVFCLWSALPLWSARASAETNGPVVSPDHRLPLVLPVALPFAVPVVGISVAVGLFTLLWLGIGCDGGRRLWAVDGLAAILVTGACWLFLDRVAVVLLPTPLLWPF